MFETAELGRALDKASYAKRVPALRTELLALQAKAREARVPIFILINGVDGAGKGETVNLLHEWMDPRYLSAHAFGPPSDEERSRPAWWRYWRALAPKGRIGLYFGNWYTEPIVGRALRRLSKNAFEAELTRIKSVERALVDDGALFVKLWFHLSKQAQQQAYRELRSSKRTRWRVTKADLKNQRRYDRFRDISERALRETSTGFAPWTIIEAADARYRNIAVGETVAAAIRERLDHRPVARPSAEQRPPPTDGRTILDTVENTQKIGDKRYDKRLEVLQGRLHNAFEELKRQRRSAIAVFEGWDAAGKGGAIRRVTAALDARDYRVIPIAAPTDEERAQHYLWRFWRHLPGAGRMTIYDRSWYGRVLVERVEGFAHEGEWQRAYNEINEFEEQLVQHGTVVAKLWLHIDQAEQLTRFRERERTSFKQFKITKEDYRNRAKAGLYVHAVHDMVERTSTDVAPWHLVAAADKRFARLDVLEHLCRRLEKAL
ncbi:MAG: polyphosphate:AMP phosphotransferase [Deltaproteobacteria bacterium RBG_16_71_12]|nr:MAG: polyphosphate:AMP phosphotransferase [Deltaproteobacteria bacterium RBG_16_71_12]